MASPMLRALEPYAIWDIKTDYLAKNSSTKTKKSPKTNLARQRILGSTPSTTSFNSLSVLSPDQEQATLDYILSQAQIGLSPDQEEAT